MSDDHLSLDELAELDEGLLDPERTSTARAHLDGCAQCRAHAEAIASARRALAAMPAAPMPADVKDRLDRALADAAPKTDTVVPNLETRRQRKFGRPSLPASAAAAVIVLAFGAIIVAAAQHHGSSGESAGAAGSVAAGAAQKAPTQPKDYVRTSTGFTYTPSKLLADVPGLVAAPEALPAAAPSPAASRTNGAVTTTPSHSIDKQAVPAAMLPLYNSKAKLLACARYLSGIPNAVPIAVDFGRWTNGAFKASPSAVIVLRDPNPQVVDVYVTGPTCSGTDAVRTFVKVPLN